MTRDQNESEIIKISERIEKEGLSWTCGQTSLSMLPPSIQEKYLGLSTPLVSFKKDGIEEQADDVNQLDAAGTSCGIPTMKDWRNVNGKNYVKGIKNQGACASGPSFDLCAAIESNHAYPDVAHSAFF